MINRFVDLSEISIAFLIYIIRIGTVGLLFVIYIHMRNRFYSSIYKQYIYVNTVSALIENRFPKCGLLRHRMGRHSLY